MNLDSLKLSVKTDGIADINKAYFRRNEEMKPNGDMMKQSFIFDEKAASVKLPMGLKAITFNIYAPGRESELLIELSAKILKGDYPKLINIDTFERMADSVNTAAISFHPDSLLNAKVLRADITDNVKLSRPPKEYIESLNIKSRYNSKWNVKKYDYQGLTFIKDVKSAELKDRLIAYDKNLEIQRDKEMMKFLKADTFKNVLRFESNQRHFSTMRRHLNLDKKADVTLRNYFESAGKVNLKILDDLTNVNSELIERYSELDLKYKEIEKLEGRRNIIIQCNYDMKLIRLFVRSHYSRKSNPSRVYKEYRELIDSMVSGKNEKIPESELIEEIKALLKAA